MGGMIGVFPVAAYNVYQTDRRMEQLKCKEPTSSLQKNNSAVFSKLDGAPFETRVPEKKTRQFFPN